MKARYILLFLLLAITAHAQQTDTDDDGKGWSFGLNFGMYYPSKYSANYYNGSDANENNIKYVLSNFYWYQDIRKELNAQVVVVAGIPSNMHYKISMQPGLHAQYNFNRNIAITADFNYMRLKAEDAISLEIDPKTYPTFPDIRLFKIRGQEERVYGDIGVKRIFVIDDRRAWFVTGGFNINNTRVQKASFFVNQREYSMINVYGNNTYIPNSNMQTFNIYQGGIGFGVFGGGGATLKFGGNIYLEPGITIHFLKIALNGYNSMRPGAGFYIRFLL